MYPALLQNQISTGRWIIGLLLLASVLSFFLYDAVEHGGEGRNEGKVISLILNSASAVLFCMLLFASLFHYLGKKITRIRWLNGRALTKADRPETDTSIQKALRPRFNGMDHLYPAIEQGVRTEEQSTLPHKFFSWLKC